MYEPFFLLASVPGDPNKVVITLSKLAVNMPQACSLYTCVYGLISAVATPAASTQALVVCEYIPQLSPGGRAGGVRVHAELARLRAIRRDYRTRHWLRVRSRRRRRRSGAYREERGKSHRTRTDNIQRSI